MIISYDAAGRIYASLDSGYPAQPEPLAMSQAEATGGALDIPPLNSDFWHVVEGEIRIRPKLEVTIEEFTEDLNQVVRLTGIPADVTVYVNGPEPTVALVSDGEPIEIEFRTPGAYRIDFDPFPFQAQLITIEVQEKAN